MKCDSQGRDRHNGNAVRSRSAFDAVDDFIDELGLTEELVAALRARRRGIA